MPAPNATGIIRAPGSETAPTAIILAENTGALNVRRQFALGMIETGNDDRAIGGAGEVSRYQIMPSVWKHYSDSPRYHDPEVSLEIAQQHWAALYSYFKLQARREPTDFDMYVLWNTGQAYYAGRAFKPARLGPIVRDRAQRFANLVEDGIRREARLQPVTSRG